nr:immunoglobulin heavy chain junction region [Mus musculus]
TVQDGITTVVAHLTT